MLDETMAKLEAMALELKDLGYEGKHEKVRALIQEAREALEGASGRLGQWESEELEYAEMAVRNNFLMLATTSIEKAIAVSRLPVNEYEYGFNYSKVKKTS